MRLGKNPIAIMPMNGLRRYDDATGYNAGIKQ